MTNKEINRESKRIFEALLLPSWAFRSQEDQEDYGVDGEVEITTSKDKATGFIFKVQLKGTSAAKYDDSGQLIFSDASVERFKYYITDLRIPLVFVVCDITTGDCYWTRVQGNHQLEAALNAAAAKEQQTFTIKFPTSRRVLKTLESSGEIVEAVESALDTITLRGLQAISPGSVRENIGHEPDIEVAEKRFRFFAGIAAGEAIRKMVRLGDFENASQKAQALLESESELPPIRVLGGLSLVHTYNVLIRRGGTPDAAITAARVKLGIASRMLQISRGKALETGTKRYVRIYTRAARLHINGRSALALVISEKAQGLQGETMAGPLTHIQRLQVSAMVSKDFFKLRDSLYRLGSHEFFSVMPYALCEIAEGILPFVSALRVLERSDLANAYVNALFDFLPFCVDVVRKFDSDTDIEEILTSLGLRFIGFADASEKSSMPALLNQFEQAIEGEPQFGCRNEVLNALQKHVERVQANFEEKEKPSMDEIRAYYAQQAAALGIDLNDPNDQIAQIVRIGLEDIDPTRVLKNCQRIYVMPTSYGLPAEILGLPTAGSKRIVCLKHGRSMEGLSLDSVYEMFAKLWPWETDENCCENCPDKAPHADGWQWSQEWNTDQHAKYQELVKRRTSEDE